MSRKKGKVLQLSGLNKKSGMRSLPAVQTKPVPKKETEKAIPQKMTMIFSDRGKPIHLSQAELDLLQKNYPERKMWPGALSWFRIRNHPGYQLPEAMKKEDQVLLWAERRNYFIEGYNMSILMNDSHTLHVDTAAPKETKSGILLPHKKQVEAPKIIQ